MPITHTHTATRSHETTQQPMQPQSHQHNYRPTTYARNRLVVPSAHQRHIVLEDDELAAMAMETKLRIDWRSVILSARHGPAPWQRQELVNDFTVYTRHESTRFSVFAMGLVPGCVAEVLNILESANSEQHAQQMEAIFTDDFCDGAIFHRVDLTATNLSAPTPDGSTLAALAVKRVAFNKSSWRTNQEEWCYVDAVYRGCRNSVVEKVMTTMQSKDINGGATSMNAVQNVVCGYLLRAGVEDPLPSAVSQAKRGNGVPRETRVCFYAEYQMPQQSAVSFTTASTGWGRSVVASEKAMKQRLIKLAHSTAQLTTLVRRQRLGLQDLVDETGFLPRTHAPCKVCTRVLLVAKQCRVCGHGVCRGCSAKYEHAQQPPGQHKVLEFTRIRVCAHCLDRMDQAEYATLTTSSLLQTLAVRDPISAKPASEKISNHVHKATVAATGPSRKSSVKSGRMSVSDIDPSSNNSSSMSSDTASLFSVTSPNTNFVHTLDCLTLDQVSADCIMLRSDAADH